MLVIVLFVLQLCTIVVSIMGLYATRLNADAIKITNRRITDMREGFICNDCRTDDHKNCPGAGWCDCQHRGYNQS